MFTLPLSATGRERRRRRLGFTLIELIVVVIVIAILAAIAGVAYNQFVGNSRDTALHATAKQVDTALTARSAHDDQTPVEIVTAHPNTLLSYLEVAAGASVTAVAYPTPAGPTAVEVTDGTRAACLTLGTEVGGASKLTPGPCGTGGDASVPTPEPTPAPVAWSSITAPSVGTYVCGIKTDRAAWCWGSGAAGQLGNGGFQPTQATPVAVAGAGGWTSLTTGTSHACGIKTDGTAWCWGSGSNGRLGNNTLAGNQSTPVLVAGGGTWRQLSAGGAHTCGIKTDGTAWCWGADSQGNLGIGGGGNKPVPTALPGAWKELTAGSSFTCGIKTDGTAWCWGYNAFGQLGNSTTNGASTPVAVSGGGLWKSLDAAEHHVCGFKTDGTAWCWGSNVTYQLGLGSAYGTYNQSSPRKVQDTGGYVSMTPGGFHTCGVKADGTAWCWGDAANGKLGSVGAAAQSSPVAVSGGGTWTSLTAGASNTCGVKVDGTAWCWGLGSSGQNGNATTGTGSTPVAVVS